MNFDDDQSANGRTKRRAENLALSAEADLTEVVKRELPGRRVARLDLNAYVAATSVRGDNVEVRDIACECRGNEAPTCQLSCNEILAHLSG